MFQPENDLAWLAGLWTRCCSTAFLQPPDEALHLARGYLGCNLVLSIEGAIWDVAAALPLHMAGSTTYADMDGWLTRGRGRVDVEAALVGPQAANEVRAALPSD